MSINYKIAIILFIILLLTPVYSQNAAESDTIVINSININTNAGETEVEIIDFKHASAWAYNIGLTLLSDAPPVIDNSGFFINQFQIEIPVGGYKKDLFYKAYFDFFRYKGKNPAFDSRFINSRLTIYIKDIYGNMRHAATAEKSCLTGNKLFEVDIPYDLSCHGKFYIVIHEHTNKTGNWGIWDIIVTSRKINELDENFIKSLLKNDDTKLKISK